MKFNLKKPCSNCPFRKDCMKGWLGKERTEDIVNTILNDGTFACHKTTEVKDEKEYSHCAGALILLDKEKGYFANVMVRLAKMFGWFDESKITGQDLIFDSKESVINHHS